jgi:aryl-alcohol dehydrogenase-like predicted oxidoreductase
MKITDIKGIYLGSGLIGIGRKWGHIDSPTPDEQTAIDFLSYATKLGIFYFDTAASYGTSEERLGKFLSRLSPEKREQLIVATKFGDHWDTQKQEAYVDHSYTALKSSLDRSLTLLNKIDLLYLHKAHTQALQSPDVEKALKYAKAQGIHHFGASVSDKEAAHLALNNDFYSVIQLPYNIANPTFSEIIDIATKKGKIVVINRPFNMGEVLYKKQANNSDKTEAFKFIIQKKFNGFILTGTKSAKHLQENYDAFIEAENRRISQQ